MRGALYLSSPLVALDCRYGISVSGSQQAVAYFSTIVQSAKLMEILHFTQLICGCVEFGGVSYPYIGGKPAGLARLDPGKAVMFLAAGLGLPVPAAPPLLPRAAAALLIASLIA
jgi:hypothetical protein